MKDKLVYVYDDTPETYAEDRERTEQRVRVAQEVGFEVVAVANRGYKSEALLQELESEMSESTGVWLDVAFNDVGINTRRLMEAAHQSGKKIAGVITPESAIPKFLSDYFRPTKSEVSK